VVCRPFDELIKEGAESDKGLRHPVLVQLVLPRTETPELLRRLSFHGVDATAIYAGHDGAAKAVKERSLWDVPDPVAPGTD
jgi:hypothetical protein